MKAFAIMVLRFLIAGDRGDLESKVAWTECAYIVICVDSESNFKRHSVKNEEKSKLPPDAVKKIICQDIHISTFQVVLMKS